jgi:enoyl-CoA hydratase
MAGTEQAPRVLIERRGPILIVTLNRPEAKNACDGDMALAINAAMDTLDDDRRWRSTPKTARKT